MYIPILMYLCSIYDCSMQISANGIVGLGDEMALLKEFRKDPFPIQNYTFIAPFYSDVYPRDSGPVKYSDQVIKDNDALKNASQQIQEAFPEHKDFFPEYLIVATWDRVGYYDQKFDMVSKQHCV